MKGILGILSLLFAGFGVASVQTFQSRYTRVESYEIRPGILATPTYAENGALCKLSVEKRHVQANLVDMSPTIPNKLSREIIEELAPPSQRGSRSTALGRFDYEMVDGSVAILPLIYENVSIEIYRDTSHVGDTAILMTWDKNCGSRGPAGLR